MQFVFESEAASAGNHAEADVEHPNDQTTLESLVEVACRKQLAIGPRVFEFAFNGGEARRTGVAGLQRFECGFGGEHARLHRQVNSLEAL